MSPSRFQVSEGYLIVPGPRGEDLTWETKKIAIVYMFQFMSLASPFSTNRTL